MKIPGQFNKWLKTPDSTGKSVIIAALSSAFLLLVPLVAMQFDSGVNWSLFDFAVAWILLFSAGFSYKLAVKKVSNNAHRFAVGSVVAISLFLVWSNLSVGLIGDGNNPVNMMCFGVLAIVVIGAVVTRFQPRLMVYVLIAAALAQMLVALTALLAGSSLLHGSSTLEILGVNGFLAMLWIGSALLFNYAGRKQTFTS
ncbi:MAG TPA: hypothetical protein VHO03_14080 [Ignavibacteriales bacterium]|nr:hypothetical protein [Ignavibacteriales bacterium]